MIATRGPTRMTLSQLLAGICEIDPLTDREIQDITLDSRAVSPGCCFFALRGAQKNGVDYANDAQARGAVALVYEAPGVKPKLEIPVIAVAKLREQLGTIANRFFESPSARVRVFAVTGTNGKTTVAHLTAQALASLDSGGGYIGTLGAGVPGALEPTANTTPDIITINRWLAHFDGCGFAAAALEVSSHALDQERISGLQLFTAVFTNLGHDHLDYHGTAAAYAASKRRLFDFSSLAAAVINIDDSLGARIAASLAPTVARWTCSSGRRRGTTTDMARVTADEVESTLDGVSFDFHANGRCARINSVLVGRFNVDNLLLIGASLLSAGYNFGDVCTSLSQLQPVPGRMEACGRNARGARVFIDYAHSPDSLEAALATFSELAPRRIHLVFGCGGNRDRSKRPLMGAVASLLADNIIITADNPRDEDVADITGDILAGIRGDATVLSIADREEAIRHAVRQALEGDIILIAGKGHEAVQEFAGGARSFSDRAVTSAILAGASP